MSTGIEWTDETWNPVSGCTKVSPGCDHCYAERITNRFGGPGAFDTVILHPDRLDKPFHWRKPRRVFVNSMSDLFHDDVPDEFIARVFAVMALTPQHTFQVLTKRHGRMRALLNREGFDAFRDEVARCAGGMGYVFDARGSDRANYGLVPGIASADLSKRRFWPGWPLPNVWLGVSVENQQWADIRIPALLQTPAAVRFVSCEPLLGPIKLDWRNPDSLHDGGLDWAIAGGESGPNARPVHPAWARWLRDQCQAAGVAFFWKQWGEWAPADHETGTHLLHVNGHLTPRSDATSPQYRGGQHIGDWDLVDRGHQGWTRMARLGKKRAGRLLDGRTWDEFPASSEIAKPEGARA